MAQHLRFGSILELPLASRLEERALMRVAEVIEAAATGLETPASVVARNPGISPLAMDSLLARFRRPNRDPISLLPAEPSSEDAAEVYTAIFSRIADHLNVALGPSGRRSFALALLVTRWMRGFPLARLISDRIRLEREKNKNNVPAAIRAVLADVEQIARFEAPRSLACYNDLLRVYLNEIDRADLAESIPDLGVMLEFGVAQQTQVSMIGLGLSRTSAVMLGDLITADDLTEDGALEWLREGIWRSAALPALVKAEIENLLSMRLPLAS
jgi:hypothetical protein